jgi:hypothetical protein
MENIKADGLLALTRSNWRKISTIKLSSYIKTKTIITSAALDAGIWQMQSGI